MKGFAAGFSCDGGDTIQALHHEQILYVCGGWLTPVIQLSSTILYTDLMWYAAFIAISAIVAYAILWLGRLMDISRKQATLAMSLSIPLSILFSLFAYFNIMSQPVSYGIFLESFKIYMFAIAPFGLVCLPYFMFTGRRNLWEHYGIDISNMWPGQIKRVKKSAGPRE